MSSTSNYVPEGSTFFPSHRDLKYDKEGSHMVTQIFVYATLVLIFIVILFVIILILKNVLMIKDYAER